MSITCMFLKPVKARFFKISHPSPPAPLGSEGEFPVQLLEFAKKVMVVHYPGKS